MEEGVSVFVPLCTGTGHVPCCSSLPGFERSAIVVLRADNLFHHEIILMYGSGPVLVLSMSAPKQISQARFEVPCFLLSCIFE